MLRVQRNLDQWEKAHGKYWAFTERFETPCCSSPGGTFTSESEPSPVQNDGAMGTVAGVSNLSKPQLNKVKFKNCRTAALSPHPFFFLSGFQVVKDFVLGPIHSYLGAQATQGLQAGHSWLPEAVGQQRLDLHCRPVNSFVNGMLIKLINGPATNAVGQRRGRYSRHTLISLQPCSTGHTKSLHW